MILTPVLSLQSKQYKQLSTYSKRTLKHGIHLSKHATRIVIVSSVVAGLSFAVINLTLLTIQITSLPLFLKVANLNLSLHTPAEAKALLSSYGHAEKLSLSVQGQNHTIPAENAGIKLDVDAILRSTQNPTGWNRLPLIYALNNHHRSFPLRYDINSKKLNTYLSSLKLPEIQQPTDASIIIPSSASQPAYIAIEKAGYLYSVEQLSSQIDQTVIGKKKLIVVAKAQTLQPKIMASQLTPAVSLANDLLKRKLTITNGEASYKLTAADVRSIVALGKSDAGLPEPIINHQAIVELLRAHSNIFYKAPTSNQISTLDGNITAQAAGSNGQAINIEASATQIARALQSGHASQRLTMSSVSPNTTYLKNYTATSAGLAALINDYAATHSGKYAVVAIELSGNRSAYYNQDTATVPASTYKLFLAYVALKKIEQGALSFSSQTTAGSLDSCLQKIILVSDNNCAQAILDLIGWTEAENQVKAAGFSATNINNSGGGYMTTTATDLVNLLKGFYNGSLLNTSSTDYIFNLMKQQEYRNGIPAGSPNSVVADKVGFLDSWNHDAAIVYAPNSTYILVILTTNSSFAQVKDLASQIYNLYNE
jgi:beta-lactamase class A